MNATTKPPIEATAKNYIWNESPFFSLQEYLKRYNLLLNLTRQEAIKQELFFFSKKKLVNNGEVSHFEYTWSVVYHSNRHHVRNKMAFTEFEWDHPSRSYGRLFPFKPLEA